MFNSYFPDNDDFNVKFLIAFACLNGATIACFAKDGQDEACGENCLNVTRSDNFGEIHPYLKL